MWTLGNTYSRICDAVLVYSGSWALVIKSLTRCHGSPRCLASGDGKVMLTWCHRIWSWWLTSWGRVLLVEILRNLIWRWLSADAPELLLVLLVGLLLRAASEILIRWYYFIWWIQSILLITICAIHCLIESKSKNLIILWTIAAGLLVCNLFILSLIRSAWYLLFQKTAHGHDFRLGPSDSSRWERIISLKLLLGVWVIWNYFRCDLVTFIRCDKWTLRSIMLLWEIARIIDFVFWKLFDKFEFIVINLAWCQVLGI